MRKKITTILIVFVLFNSGFLMAQDLLKGTDLSTVKVDYLTDADVAKIKNQLQTNNMTIEQAEPMALAKGMPAAEFAKLKIRLGLKNTTPVFSKTDTKENDSEELVLKQEKIVNIKVKDTLNALVFGSELFDNPTLNFEPNLKLATPVNYILGPGDELQLSVYGVQEFNSNIPVSIEGKITIQYVGQLSVSGMTIEAASQKIKGAMARVYTTLNSGQSQISISLSRIRTIRITLIGSKQPGNYSVSSLATAYNALFLGGGPGKNGSYRNIELIRNNKIYKKIDLYNFLLNGNQADNVGLKDNDVIRIPTYTTRVTVEGQVKRPGIFEMKSGEHFSDLLVFASGFNQLAYTSSVKVIQKTAKEYKVKDINSADYKSYIPQANDLITVTKILNRFENRVSINGSVFRPGTYSLTEGLRIADLIKQAEGLKEDAYKYRARIIRLKPDLTNEIISVNLVDALKLKQEANIVLLREDEIIVYSILDFQEDYKIIIEGEVRNPGEYKYHELLSLNDLLIEAGGLLGSASKRVEVARMIKLEEIDDSNPSRVQLFNLEISPLNNEQLKNFTLEPFDVVSIRKMGMYERPKMVAVSGAVAYPGKYVLANKTEKIYDVILRAGGLTKIAEINGVRIKRPIKAKQIELLEAVDINLQKDKDSTKIKIDKKLKEGVGYATIPVNWIKISKDQTNYSNVSLQEGDEIVVATYDESVKVDGFVLLNSEIPWRKGKGISYYINAAGGENAKGWKKKSYVVYPNGEAEVSRSFLFFRNYPRVTAGSQIIVPEKPVVKKTSTAEFVSIAGIMASLAGVVIAILKL